MRSSIKLISIIIIFSYQLCHAELLQHDDIRYWQLIQNEELSLNQLVSIPNDEWKELPSNRTILNALDNQFWQVPNGSNMLVKIELPRIVDTERVWIELSPNVGLNGKMAIYENGNWVWKLPAGRHGSNHSEFPATFLTFAIDKPREHRLIFLKLNSSQVFNFSINIRAHDSQLSLLASRNLIYGMCFGLMLLAALYNLVIGLSANERVYVYYAFYVLGIFLYMLAMTGYNRLAFPEWGGDGSFTNLTACIAMFAATIFVREFLETPKTIPKLDTLLKVQQAALFITIFLLGFISDKLAFILVETIGIIIPIITLICALGALKKKHPMARLFLLAWCTHIVTGSLWAWMWLGFSPPTLELLSIFITGSIIELLMLSIILGYNYASLKQKSANLAKVNARNYNDSEHDHLTGLYNRQGLYSHIERLMKSNENDLIWIDINIDDFSEFNTTHGIHNGDILLSEFGQLLQSKVRRDNLAAKLIDKENSFSYRRGVAGRVNGGQFTVVLSNCSLPQARLYVERMARDFENIRIKSSAGKWLNATICAGVINVLPNENFHSAWQRANKKMISAKSKGHNQLSFS